MVTLGVDLAAQDADTGICRVRWADREAAVELAQRGASDEQILDEARAAVAAGGAVGVDAPLGWPAAFAAAVAAWAGGGAWPLARSPEPEARRRQSSLLRLRETDRFVVETTRARGRALHPLSVSTDKIGIPAMRAAALLSAAGRAEPRRRALVRGLSGRRARPLGAAAGEQQARAHGARAAAAGARRRRRDGGRGAAVRARRARGLPRLRRRPRRAAVRLRRARRGAGETFPPPDAAHADAAKREGWIHMPCGGLADLFTERQSGRYVRSGG